MRLLFQKSGLGSTGFIIALVVGLWLTLLFSSFQQKSEAAVIQPQKARLGLVLPTVITPLMPQEVRNQEVDAHQAHSWELNFPNIYKAVLEF